MTIQDDLRRLAEAATPGQWTTEKPGKDADGFSQGMIIAAVGRGQGIYANPPGGSFPEADRRFIAAANPATILALCDQLDAQAAEIASLTMALQDIATQSNKIATLLAENDALRAQVETVRNDALEEAAKIVDCISPEFPKSAATLIDAIRVLKAPTQ